MTRSRSRRQEHESPLLLPAAPAPDNSEDELRTAALADEKIRALVDGNQVVKVIVVPRRLVNVVIR